MPSSVKITLGLCTKNAEDKTVQRAIKSILQQEFPHELMEVLVVIDERNASKTAMKIREAFSKSNIALRIFLGQTKGLGDARQKVVEEALGQLIIWVDDDILLPKKYLQQLVRLMDSNPLIASAQGLMQYEEKTLADLLENLAELARYRKKLYNLMRIGTVGAVCRVAALKQVGGFDRNIIGAGEDADVTTRIRMAGLGLATYNAIFYHESRSWKDLWNQSFWYGYSMYTANKKQKNLTVPWKNLPPVTAIGGLSLSMKSYKVSGRKIVFLLPFEHAYKGMAWSIGYMRKALCGKQDVLA